MPLVTSEGFAEALPVPAYDLALDTPLTQLSNELAAAERIRIPFPSFADGRGFSLARRLRDLGYEGHIRATGHIIADQYAYALTCGFDEVEIDEALAARQPAEQWHAAGLPSYHAKLRGTLADKR